MKIDGAGVNKQGYVDLKLLSNRCTSCTVYTILSCRLCILGDEKDIFVLQVVVCEKLKYKRLMAYIGYSFRTEVGGEVRRWDK